MKAASIPLEESAKDIESARAEFADMVIACAIECRNNAELLDRLKRELPKDFLFKMGEGSTRRCFATPLGISIKIQREDTLHDPLSDKELEERGGAEYLPQLFMRRRTANLSELIYSIKHPNHTPQIYGFLGSFGIVQQNPSVLIVETVKTLDRYILNDGRGVATRDMGLDADDALHIYDSRLTPMSRPTHLKRFEDMAGETEPLIWLGNIGVTADSRYVLVDRSDHGNPMQLLNEITMNPHVWGWTWRGTSAQTLEFSKNLFSRYQQAGNTQKKGGKHG